MLDQDTRIQLLPLKDNKTIEALEALFDVVLYDMKQRMSQINLDDPNLERKLIIDRARIDGAQKMGNLIVEYLTKHIKG